MSRGLTLVLCSNEHEKTRGIAFRDGSLAFTLSRPAFTQVLEVVHRRHSDRVMNVRGAGMSR
jgi:hypothetical protein